MGKLINLHIAIYVHPRALSLRVLSPGYARLGGHRRPHLFRYIWDPLRQD